MEVKGRVHVVYRRSAIKRETGQRKEDLHNEGRRREGVLHQWKQKALCGFKCSVATKRTEQLNCMVTYRSCKKDAQNTSGIYLKWIKRHNLFSLLHIKSE